LSELLALLDKYAGLPPDRKEAIKSEVMKATGHLRWVPNPGPQTAAYECEADELFFGGSAGSSKTDLLIGLSLTQHHRSLVLRRTNKEASKLFERYYEIIRTKDGWNGHDSIWRIDGRVIDIGGCQLEVDKQKYKGQPHDLIAFDELPDFTESQYTFITTWNRPSPGSRENQRCRVVAAGNPPTTPEGLWVIQYWAPWLDKRHPNPAKPGELRWFVGGQEVEGPGMYEVDGRPSPARSRTFIPGKLEDNPDLVGTNYDAVLASLPEELRLAYREGRFDVGLKDNPWQIIPTDWIRKAQARWLPEPPRGIPMCAIGVDIAQGGADNTVLSCRHDGWFAPNIKVPGKETPDGSTVAALVILHRRDLADIVLDMGGGYGGDTHGRLQDNGITAKKHVGSNESFARTEDQTLRFYNKRTEVYWRFREALNPDQFGGSTIALPEDPALVADLTAVTWTMGPNGTIKAITKEELVKKLGRSPDDGDAVVIAWSSGPRAASHANDWRPDARVRRPAVRRMPQVNMGPRRH
jgi:hypothetical protein